MDKVYNHKDVEEKIYKSWEDKGYFKPEVNPQGQPFSIILPPPNANAPLHFGHAMYTVEDILVRYHRMKGDKTLWLPGADHAGFETQFVFEKKLQEEGKSRFDYDRETLYKMIWDFVQTNRPVMEGQLKRLGFSLDWSRKKFTLDPDVVKIVYKTFKNLYDDGLVYRAERLVNYCTFDGTSFSDLEVVVTETKGTLYKIAYPIVGGGEIVVATSRPETLYGDAAVMVNPSDERYKELVGKKVKLPLTDREIPIIEDDFVQMDKGTGAVKTTPLHNFDDWEVGQRHKLEGKQVIGLDGKMINTRAVDGLYGKQAKVKTLELLEKDGFLRGEEEYISTKGTCYKCGNPIEPLPLEQWFVKMEPLAKPAIEAIKKTAIKIHPKSFEKLYFQFLENIRDWNISRQIAWGIRIPAWKNKKTGEWIVTEGDVPDGADWSQDEDTFDTWFSSGQWPYATLLTTESSEFYPTSVMETGYDILRWWVARMAMLGIYIQKKNGVGDLSQQAPFRNIALHGLVKDPLGKKMSKSKGNVVNPLELVDQYGADAVRFALIYGTAFGNDQSLSYPKLQASRNFANKLWNIGRFVEFQFNSDIFKDKEAPFYSKDMKINKQDKEILKELNTLILAVTKSMDEFRFHDGADALYEFAWHKLADVYIEQMKERSKTGDVVSLSILRHIWMNLLKLLHPYMPFITEELWSKFPRMKQEHLIISSWPNE